MKKLLLSVIALLAVLSFGLQAEAADRVTKIVKSCKYTVTALAADAVLTMADGSAYCDVSNMVVDRVVLEWNLPTVSGGSGIVLKAITTSDPTNIGGSTTDSALLGSDGSTAFVSPTITSTPIGSRGSYIATEGASGLDSNLGTKVGVWGDTTGSTVTGTVWLTIFGRI
jgi:hypothetical protein